MFYVYANIDFLIDLKFIFLFDQVCIDLKFIISYYGSTIIKSC